MNKELLTRVMKAIKKHPLNTEMVLHWVTHEDTVSPCGTAGCIAGWTVAEARLRNLRNSPRAGPGSSLVEKQAAFLLGLEPAQANRLFMVGQWPKEFRERHGEDEAYDEDVRLHRSKVVVERIEHFIKTDGRE